VTGEEIDVRARSVVVATGVWTGGLVEGVQLQPSKGAHVLVRADAVGNPTSGFSILVPGSRNRFVFAVPRPDGTVQVGLTEDAVDAVVRRLGLSNPCVTTTTPLVGAGAPPRAPSDRLARRFGSEAADVAACGPREPVAPGVPALRCEVGWAVAAEGAVTPDDV